MTGSNYISGRQNVGKNLLRALFLTASAIGGIFILATSAVFAFFLAIGVALIGGLTFFFFWARAKLFGRPFGPKAHFEKARAEMEAQFKTQEYSSTTSGQGPIIDAHQTPKGWTVDE